MILYFVSQNGESSHVLRIFDEEAQAMQSVQNSKRMLQESLSTGAAILSKYSEQRERLKVGAQVLVCSFARYLCTNTCTLFVEWIQSFNL